MNEEINPLWFPIAWVAISLMILAACGVFGALILWQIL
jgi:hypothetical protein